MVSIKFFTSTVMLLIVLACNPPVQKSVLDKSSTSKHSVDKASTSTDENSLSADTSLAYYVDSLIDRGSLDERWLKYSNGIVVSEPRRQANTNKPPYNNGHIFYYNSLSNNVEEFDILNNCPLGKKQHIIFSQQETSGRVYNITTTERNDQEPRTLSDSVFANALSHNHCLPQMIYNIHVLSNYILISYNYYSVDGVSLCGGSNHSVLISKQNGKQYLFNNSHPVILSTITQNGNMLVQYGGGYVTEDSKSPYWVKLTNIHTMEILLNYGPYEDTAVKANAIENSNSVIIIFDSPDTGSGYVLDRALLFDSEKNNTLECIECKDCVKRMKTNAHYSYCITSSGEVKKFYLDQHYTQVR